MRLALLAWIALLTHVAAALGSLFLLQPGTPVAAEAPARAEYIAAHLAAWRVGWLCWTLASISLVALLAALHRPAAWPALVALLVFDLPSQFALAWPALALERLAYVGTGVVANSIYTIALAWALFRGPIPGWVKLAGAPAVAAGAFVTVASWLLHPTLLFLSTGGTHGLHDRMAGPSGGIGARVAIIGRGVFGSLAAEELRAQGHEATAFSRSSGVDARDEASVREAARSFDAILHAAGPFRGQPPSAARAAAALGIPYADLSDDEAFSGSVRALDVATPLLTGMSTTPALAEALAAIARGGDRGADATCAMYVGGGNEQGPATMAFAARSRARGPPILVEFGPLGRRRAYPARAFFDGEYFVAVGGLAGLAWRFPPLLRALAPLAPHVPRLSADTTGALVVSVGDRRGGLYAREGGQRMAVLPAIWALEEALAGRAPKRAALPHEWVEPEKLVAFVAARGFTRLGE